MGSTAGFVLRRYVTTDLDGVIQVFQRAIREVACRDYDPAQVAAWSKVDRDDWEASITARPFFENRGFVVDAQQQVTKENEFINFRMDKILHLTT